MDAYGEDGSMLVSMEFAVRVIEEALPQAGDDTLSVGVIAGIMGVTSAAMAAAIRRMKRTAA